MEITDLLDYRPVHSTRLDVQVFTSDQITAMRDDWGHRRKARIDELTSDDIQAMNLPHVVVHQLPSGLYYATLEKDRQPVPIPRGYCTQYVDGKSTSNRGHALEDGFVLHAVTYGKSIVVKNNGNFSGGDPSKPSFRLDTSVSTDVPTSFFMWYLDNVSLTPTRSHHFFCVSLSYDNGHVKTEFRQGLYGKTPVEQHAHSEIIVKLLDDALISVSGLANSDQELSEPAAAMLLAQKGEWLHLNPTDSRAGTLLEQVFEQDIQGQKLDLRELVAHIALEAKEGRSLKPQDMPVFFS